MFQHLSLMWEAPSLFLSLNFFQPFRDEHFRIQCQLDVTCQLDHEISLAQQDLALFRSETAVFLTPPKLHKPTQPRRGATMGLDALGSGGLYGGGLAVGGSDSCGYVFFKLSRSIRNKC